MTLKNMGVELCQTFSSTYTFVFTVPAHVRRFKKAREKMLTFAFMDLHTARFHYKLHRAPRNNAGERIPLAHI